MPFRWQFVPVKLGPVLPNQLLGRESPRREEGAVKAQEQMSVPIEVWHVSGEGRLVHTLSSSILASFPFEPRLRRQARDCMQRRGTEASQLHTAGEARVVPKAAPHNRTRRDAAGSGQWKSGVTQAPPPGSPALRPGPQGLHALGTGIGDSPR